MTTRLSHDRRYAPDPSAVGFIANVVFAAIGIVMAVALIATASPAVTIPISVVLVAGLVASAFAAAGDAWLTSRRRRSDSPRPAAPAQQPASIGAEHGAGIRGASVAHGQSFDWVSDASFDSFPASDAPSWTGVRLGSPG